MLSEGEVFVFITLEAYIGYIFGMFYEKNTFDSINFLLFTIISWSFASYITSKVKKGTKI